MNGIGFASFHPPVTGFNIGGAETQGPITRVCWLIRKDGEAGSYSLFQKIIL